MGKQEVRKFHITVKNRRLVVEGKEDHEPVFKARLWKVKANGNVMEESHWFERDMWLSEAGSLVYYSKKEDKELVYYTHADLMNCTVEEVTASARPWAFRVTVQATDEIEYSPGEFAAESEEMRAKWIEAFRHLN